MSWYNYPTNVSNLGELAVWANTETSGMLGNFIIITTFLIIFISLSYTTKSSKVLPVTSFITFIISVLFIRMAIIHPAIPYVLAIATIVGIFWAKGDTSPY